jgi:transcription antitermination factor NusG
MIGTQVDPWLVLRTRSRHENTVARCLKEKSIISFLPTHNVLRRRKHGGVVLGVPLFPGYVFVQPRADQFEKIRYIPGSCGLLLLDNRPAAMPESDLEAVKILVRSGAALAANPRLIPGERVEVVSGPFMGIQGELVRFQARERLVINAQLLGCSVSVEVDSTTVCPL